MLPSQVARPISHAQSDDVPEYAAHEQGFGSGQAELLPYVSPAERPRLEDLFPDSETLFPGRNTTTSAPGAGSLMASANSTTTMESRMDLATSGPTLEDLPSPIAGTKTKEREEKRKLSAKNTDK